MSTLLFPEESYKIRSAIYEVHSQLGCGLLESVYQEALEKELRAMKIPYQSQLKVPVHYKGRLLDKYFLVDFLCFGKIIMEIKSVKRIESIHKAQVINYLCLSRCSLGFLVNFNSYPSVTIERLIRRFNT